MRALVVGAGIGGLTAAIALRRAGIDVALFERRPVLHEIGAGISLWANAVHALDQIGVGDAVRAASTAYGVAGLRSWDGEILTSPSGDIEHKLGVLCIVMHRAELQDALLQAFGREHVQLGARCTRFEQDADGITAEFSDGRRARGDALVGADGLRSIIRAQLHGDTPPRYAGYTAWRSVVSYDTDRIRASESLGFGARFGQVPMSGRRVYWFATENAPEGGRHPDEQAHLRALFRNWHEPIRALIEAAHPSSILRNDIYDRPPLRTWGIGRATLLGDAAHPMTPNLGQGGCQAIEDAVVLARCLREHADPVVALRTYEARRIPRTSAVVAQSRRVGAVGQWSRPLAVRLRNTVMKRVSRRLQARALEAVVGYRV